MTKPADRLRKPAPKFGLEEFDPTFDARQGAAALLDEAERNVAEALKRWNVNRDDGAIGVLLRPLLAKLRGEQ